MKALLLLPKDLGGKIILSLSTDPTPWPIGQIGTRSTTSTQKNISNWGKSDTSLCTNNTIRVFKSTEMKCHWMGIAPSSFSMRRWKFFSLLLRLAKSIKSILCRDNVKHPIPWSSCSMTLSCQYNTCWDVLWGSTCTWTHCIVGQLYVNLAC